MHLEVRLQAHAEVHVWLANGHFGKLVVQSRHRGQVDVISAHSECIGAMNLPLQSGFWQYWIDWYTNKHTSSI